MGDRRCLTAGGPGGLANLAIRPGRPSSADGRAALPAQAFPRTDRRAVAQDTTWPSMLFAAFSCCGPGCLNTA